MKKWFVFYTKSRHEKKVKDFLEKRGFEVFLPMQRVLRQWSDRKKKVDVPLFNSYIFVKESEEKIPDILQVPGISWNIRHNNKPAVLHDHEWILINRFLESGYFIETGQVENFSAGDAVEIMDGPLKGIQGYVVRTSSGNRFTIAFESIGNSMFVDIDPVLLKKQPTAGHE